MAYLKIHNITVRGISAAVPKTIIDNLNSPIPLSKDYSNAEFVEQTGVKQRRVDENLTASDLGFAAASNLISELKWDPKEIEAIIFVSQFFDFIAPATACILQDKLGLSRKCLAFDIELGCSGWVYGLGVLSSLMQNGYIRKGLLIAGDGKRNYDNSEKYNGALFGHAATATALEFKEGAAEMYFDLGTDGSGYDALMVKGGGARYPFNRHSLDEYEENGVITTDLSSKMKGMDVFAFGISTAPKSLKAVLKESGKEVSNVDFLILHQANKQMNDIIVRKLKINPKQVPSSLDNFGNTSSASIPLTIVTSLRDELKLGNHNILCCGFGIGLSWGSVFFKTEKVVIPDLIEVDSDEQIM